MSFYYSPSLTDYIKTEKPDEVQDEVRILVKLHVDTVKTNEGWSMLISVIELQNSKSLLLSA